MGTASDSSSALLDLVLRFNRNSEHYRGQQYLEAQVRTEFLDPLFELLGWDVRNRNGATIDRREVISESRQDESLVDYSFRIGNRVEFLVEAKRPMVDIERDPKPARQLRDYGHRAKLKLSILTNFHRLAVYDCRSPPRAKDGPEVGRVLLMRYNEYPNQWPTIKALFAKESVIRGSLDRYFEQETRSRTVVEMPSTPPFDPMSPATASPAPSFQPLPAPPSQAAPPPFMPAPPVPGPREAAPRQSSKVPAATRAMYRKLGLALVGLILLLGGVGWALAGGGSIRPEEAMGCSILTRGAVHLRSQPTYRSVGIPYPAGTQMRLVAPLTTYRRGGSTLFQVNVLSDGRTGYIFVGTEELRARFGCPER